MTTVDDERADYIAGLRAMADFIEAHPEVRVPLSNTYDVFVDSADEFRDAIRTLPGIRAKGLSHDEAHMIVTANIGGNTVRVWAGRDQVCHRVVKGVREVTVTVPAPDAPTVQVTRTVEDIEWVCEPLLATAGA